MPTENERTSPETGSLTTAATRPVKRPSGLLGQALTVIGLAGVGAASGALRAIVVIFAGMIFAFVGAAVGAGLGGAILGPYLTGQTGVTLGSVVGAGFGIYHLVTHLDEILD